MGKYYLDKDNKVYRQLASDPTSAVCMVPPDIHNVIPVDTTLSPLPKYKAKELINKAWDNHKDTWTYNGKHFKADKTLLELESIYKEKSTFGFNIWEFDGKYGRHSYQSNGYTEHYWVGQFQGKIICYQPYHYCPQAYAWEYDSNNTNNKGRSIGFVPMKHIKPIWNITDKCWL